MHGGLDSWVACSQFFLNGKTLPIDRGMGLRQPAMQTAAALLAGGDWVHIFPEGRVGYSGRLQACKRGVGKLVCDAMEQSGRCGIHIGVLLSLCSSPPEGCAEMPARVWQVRHEAVHCCCAAGLECQEALTCNTANITCIGS